MRPARLAAVLVLVAAPAAARPAHATVVASAEWHAPLGGATSCEQVATTTVACRHAYSSSAGLGALAPPETCTAVAVDTVATTARVGDCHAELTGLTSGPGRMVDPSTAACGSSGVFSVRFDISGPFGSYGLDVTATVNAAGVGFVQAAHPTSGGVQVLEARITGACGLPAGARGSFAGTWRLVR